MGFTSVTGSSNSSSVVERLDRSNSSSTTAPGVSKGSSSGCTSVIISKSSLISLLLSSSNAANKSSERSFLMGSGSLDFFAFAGVGAGSAAGASACGAAIFEKSGTVTGSALFAPKSSFAFLFTSFTPLVTLFIKLFSTPRNSSRPLTLPLPPAFCASATIFVAVAFADSTVSRAVLFAFSTIPFAVALAFATISAAFFSAAAVAALSEPFAPGLLCFALRFRSSIWISRFSSFLRSVFNWSSRSAIFLSLSSFIACILLSAS